MNSEASRCENDTKNDGFINESTQIDTCTSQHYVADTFVTPEVQLEHKKCFKRKRSTQIEKSTDTAIDYIQRNNKRKRIELHTFDKENIDKKVMLMRSSVEPATKHETKNMKDNNNQMTTVTNRLQLKYENIHATTVQKLTAYTERLRLEINTLRSALAIERNAVRVLR